MVFWLKSLFKIKNEGPAHESRADDTPAAVAAPTTGTGPVWAVIMEDVFKSMCKVVGAPWQWQRVLDDHNGLSEKNLLAIRKCSIELVSTWACGHGWNVTRAMRGAWFVAQHNDLLAVRRRCNNEMRSLMPVSYEPPQNASQLELARGDYASIVDTQAALEIGLEDCGLTHRGTVDDPVVGKLSGDGGGLSSGGGNMNQVAKVFHFVDVDCRDPQIGRTIGSNQRIAILTALDHDRVFFKNTVLFI